MSITENEVAADNQRRRMEEISKSPAGGVIENAVTLARPALAVGAALTASGASSATGIAIAGSVVAGLGIVDWFRKLGSAKVNENLEALGQATEDALNRVEATLRAHGTTIDEINRRLNSAEFKEGMASAALQALRTSQQSRLKRMALILANGIKEDDLEPESLDDMMRAAVELKDADIVLLERIYKIQVHIIREVTGTDNDRLHRIVTDWTARTKLRIENGGIELGSCRGSLARLQAQAFIQLRTPGFDAGAEIAVLLEDGAKFYERLQEIAIQQ